MITFLILTFLLLFKFRNDPKVIRFIVIAYLLAILIYVLKLLEVFSGNLEYFISDEAYYFDEGTYSTETMEESDRFLWLVVNYFMRYIDFGGIVGVKLINIPIGIAAILVLSKIFKHEIPYTKYLFYLPYLLIIFTLNFRDLLILFSVLYLIHNIEKGIVRGSIKIIFSAALIFMLRPLFLFLVLFIVVFVNFMSSRRAIFKSKRIIISFFAAIFILLLSFIIFREAIFNLYERAFLNIENKMAGVYFEMAEQKGLDLSGNIWYDMIGNLFRFVFTPLPTSLILRLVRGEENDWGIVDDFVRVFHQIFYFYFLFYLFFNFRVIPKIIRSLTNTQKHVMFYLFATFPIYAFYLMGAAHQRIKLPFQIAIFILYFLMVKYKKNKVNVILK